MNQLLLPISLLLICSLLVNVCNGQLNETKLALTNYFGGIGLSDDQIAQIVGIITSGADENTITNDYMDWVAALTEQTWNFNLVDAVDNKAQMLLAFQPVLSQFGDTVYNVYATAVKGKPKQEKAVEIGAVDLPALYKTAKANMPAKTIAKIQPKIQNMIMAFANDPDNLPFKTLILEATASMLPPAKKSTLQPAKKSTLQPAKTSTLQPAKKGK